MKKLVAAGILTITLIAAGASSGAAKTVDRILAKVNDEIITLSELNRELEPFRREIMATTSGAQREQALKDAEEGMLNRLIEASLIYQKAIELEYNAQAEERVDSYIQQIMKDNNLKDTEELENALAREGKSLRTYKEDIERQIISQDLVNDYLGSRISLLTPEIERYYQNHLADFTTPEEVTLSEIIIDAADGDEAAQTRIVDITKRFHAGEPFATLAEKYSKGATASKGGGIGSYVVDKLNPETRKVITGVKEGDISTAQQSKEGFIIYRVDVRKPAVVKPLEEVKDGIRNILYQQKRSPEYDRFIAQLKEDAYIQIFPEMQ